MAVLKVQDVRVGQVFQNNEQALFNFLRVEHVITEADRTVAVEVSRHRTKEDAESSAPGVHKRHIKIKRLVSSSQKGYTLVGYREPAKELQGIAA